MSYNELEQGYLGLTSQPLFYIGDDCGYLNRNKIEKVFPFALHACSYS